MSKIPQEIEQAKQNLHSNFFGSFANRMDYSSGLDDMAKSSHDHYQPIIDNQQKQLSEQSATIERLEAGNRRLRELLKEFVIGDGEAKMHQMCLQYEPENDEQILSIYCTENNIKL